MSGLKRIKTEKDMQVRFTRWLRSGGGTALAQGKCACACELKLVRLFRSGVAGLRWSEVRDHQVVALKRAAGLGSVGLGYKISDSGVGYKPFDCFWLEGCPAYVVVGFMKSADGSDFECWAVSIARWLLLRDSGMRSLGLETCRSMGIRCNI